jgi:hypothetical protein
MFIERTRTNFVPEIFKYKSVYNAVVLPILLYGIEISTWGKEQKTTDINRDENFQKNSRIHTF